VNRPTSGRFSKRPYTSHPDMEVLQPVVGAPSIPGSGKAATGLKNVLSLYRRGKKHLRLIGSLGNIYEEPNPVAVLVSVQIHRRRTK
jgi:hypothetical protein